MSNAFEDYFDGMDNEGDENVALDSHLGDSSSIISHNYKSWFERKVGQDSIELFTENATFIEYVIHQINCELRSINESRAADRKINLESEKISDFLQNILMNVRYGIANAEYNLAGLVSDFCQTLDVSNGDYFQIGEAVGKELFGDTHYGVILYGIMATAVLEFRGILFSDISGGDDLEFT